MNQKFSNMYSEDQYPCNSAFQSTELKGSVMVPLISMKAAFFVDKISSFELSMFW